MSVWEDGKVKTDGFTTPICLTPLNWTLKMVQMAHFTLCVFDQSKENEDLKGGCGGGVWGRRSRPLCLEPRKSIDFSNTVHHICDKSSVETKSTKGGPRGAPGQMGVLRGAPPSLARQRAGWEGRRVRPQGGPCGSHANQLPPALPHGPEVPRKGPWGSGLVAPGLSRDSRQPGPCTHLPVLVVNEDVPCAVVPQVRDLQAMRVAYLGRLKGRIQMLDLHDGLGLLGLGSRQGLSARWLHTCRAVWLWASFLPSLGLGSLV